jgi:hypothetical protein
MTLLGTQARITIDSPSQGNVRLRFNKSSKVVDGATAEAKNAMGSDVPVGFIFKPGAQTITLEVYVQQGVKPECDFKEMKRNREIFSMVREIVGGQETQYLPCVVSKVDEDDDEEGGHMQQVEIIGLEQLPL